MCEHPNLIPNPNYGKPKRMPYLLYDTTSKYIQMPCGNCSQCINVKQMHIVQRVQMEGLNNWLFYVTLTYNNQSLPICTINGRNFAYAEINDWQDMMKRIRENNLLSRPFKYMLVSEFGTERGRPHFHSIISMPKRKDDNEYFTPLNLEHELFNTILHNWQRNVGESTKKPEYQKLCTYVRRIRYGRIESNYDCHYIQPYQGDSGQATVGFYVTKYMLKGDKANRERRTQQALKMNLGEIEYDFYWKLIKTKIIFSKGFGKTDTNKAQYINIHEHIKNSIKTSAIAGYPFACFKNPDTGQYFPLAKIYRDWITFEDAKRFYKNREHKEYLDTISFQKEHDQNWYEMKQSKYEKNSTRTKNGQYDNDLEIEEIDYLIDHYDD